MSAKPGLNRIQKTVEALDEGLTIIPFKFQINGTSDPDHLSGDYLSTCTRNEAGEFACALRNIPAGCFYGHADVSSTADDVDIYAKVDWSQVAVDGTFTVRCMTGSTETDPTDDLFVGGFLIVKKTTRRRTGLI